MIGQHSVIVELEDAIRSGTDQHRVETLRRVTDLFLTGAERYSDDQVALFDDVIGRLATHIETKARSELAERLAPVPNAPVKVIKTLAADEKIEVAGPVLAQSDRLDERDLLDAAATKSQQHLLAIAQRKSLDETVTDVLVARGDREVVRSVARNTGARFSNAGFGILVDRSEGDDVLAECVGLRADIPRHHFTMLIAKASETVQKKLAAANPQAADAIRDVVGGLADQMEVEAGKALRDYSAARTLVDSLQRSGQLGETEVSAFARSGRFEETVVALSVLCGLPIEAVERAMLDEHSDMVLILARAAGFSWPTAKIVMLLRSGGRSASKQDMEHAAASFNRLQAGTAQRVMRFYRVRQSATKGTA